MELFNILFIGLIWGVNLWLALSARTGVALAVVAPWSLIGAIVAAGLGLQTDGLNNADLLPAATAALPLLSVTIALAAWATAWTLKWDSAEPTTPFAQAAKGPSALVMCVAATLGGVLLAVLNTM